MHLSFTLVKPHIDLSIFSVIRRVNTDGTGLTTVGPPTFGRLNALAFHKNGYGFTGM
jgi:hypothetical protein